MRRTKKWLAVIMAAAVVASGAGATQLGTVAAYAAEDTTTPADESKTDDTKSDDAKTDDTKSDDTKTDDTKTDDTKSDDTKTDDTKSDDTKTDDTKTDETKTDESKATTPETYTPEDVSWSSDFTTLTADGTVYNTVREFDKATGLVKVTAKESGVVGKTDKLPDSVYYYYDLNNSKLVYVSGGKDLDKSTWANDAATKLLDTDNATYKVALILNQPSYTKDYKASTATKTEPLDKLGAWELNVKTDPEEIDVFATADQTVAITVNAKLSSNIVIDGKKEDTADVYGIIPGAKITVNPTEAPVGNESDFYFDSVSKDNSIKTAKVYYDGTEHKIIAKDYTGYSVSYTLYNPETGKYDAKDSVGISHVQKDAARFKATFKKGNSTKDVPAIDVNLKAVDGVVFGFDEDASIVDGGCEYKVEGATYNATDYIAVTVKEGTDKDIKAAAEKAIAADEKDLKALFNDIFTIKEETSKVRPDDVTLKIEKKELTEKEKTDLNKKYEQLLLDYGWANVAVAQSKTAEKTATVFLNEKPEIMVYVDSTTVEEGQTPTFNFKVCSVISSANGTKEKDMPDFDKSLVKFTTIGGQALNTLKPGAYKLAATAEGYKVTVYGANSNEAVYGTLTVVAKAADTTTPAKTTLKASKITKVALAKKTFKASALKKKKATTTIKVTKKTGNGKITYAKTSGNKKITVSKAGKVTLKKGLKKGTYKVKVKVTMAKSATYKKATKTVTLTIKVK